MKKKSKKFAKKVIINFLLGATAVSGFSSEASAMMGVLASIKSAGGKAVNSLKKGPQQLFDRSQANSTTPTPNTSLAAQDGSVTLTLGNQNYQVPQGASVHQVKDGHYVLATKENNYFIFHDGTNAVALQHQQKGMMPEYGVITLNSDRLNTLEAAKPTFQMSKSLDKAKQRELKAFAKSETLIAERQKLIAEISVEAKAIIIQQNLSESFATLSASLRSGHITPKTLGDQSALDKASDLVRAFENSKKEEKRLQKEIAKLAEDLHAVQTNDALQLKLGQLKDLRDQKANLKTQAPSDLDLRGIYINIDVAQPARVFYKLCQ